MSDHDTRELFADGIMELGFGNGMVRMDLYSLSAVEKDADGNPKREFRQRIIMPPQGFLESFSTMQEMFKRLETAGVIRRRDGADNPPAEKK
ncbi:MAG: hypothetical protein O3A84_04055 [Proteobacteria bacterium]|nr:hypothetical protein [Pseudomonadota bacterium]